MAATTKVQHSKFDPQEFNPGLNVLYPNDEDVSSKAGIKVDIIAIPGLGANPEYTWKKDKVHWLRDTNMLARKIPNARISIFNYQSQWFGRGAISQRLESVANSLLHALDRPRRNETNKTPIIFVCHCLGGIILEKAILTSRIRQNEFPTVYPWVAGCVFLGTPFHGTSTQAKAMVLARMAETIGWGNSSNLLKMLEKDSDILKGLLEEFALLARDAQIRLFCFFEENKSDLSSLFIKGGLPWTTLTSELIVDEASATITAVDKLALKSDHFHLNKFEGPKDGNYRYVSEEIWITAQKAEGILKSRQNILRQALVDDRTYHSILDHMGKGFQDIDAAINGSYKGPKASKLSSVLELEKFKQWRNEHTTQILWIHGKAGGQGAVASSAVEYLNNTQTDDSIVVSFFCDESDRQRRSFRGLLQMLVRQIVNEHQDLARHLLSDSRRSKDGSAQDFNPEESLKVSTLWDALHSMAKDLPNGTVHIVLYGVEQLADDSLTEFLHHFKDFPDIDEVEGDLRNGRSVKWLILSRTGRPSIKNLFSRKAHEIDLQNAEVSVRVSNDLRNHISARVDELHLPSSLAYFVKRHIHSRAEDDWTYVNLVIQELKNTWVPGQTQYADIRKLLESFPYGLTNMFEFIRRRVLDPRADAFEYTKELLRCLLCAHVAPTMSELAVIAGLPTKDREDVNAIKEYIVRCGAFLTLRGEEWDMESNTVEWIHISAPEHLRQYAKDDLSLDLFDVQHGIIALRSLDYIYQTFDRYEATKPDCKIFNGEHGSITDEGENEDPKCILDDMLKYPIRFWVEHAQRAPQDMLDELDTTHSFWHDKSELRQEWWSLIRDVHAISDQTCVSALHVAVILNVPALVDHLLEHGWAEDLYKEDSLGFQPLYYACKVGQEEIVNSLLGAGADINFANDDKPTALHAATCYGHYDIATTLLDRDANLDATSTENGTPLYEAVANAHNEMVKMLLDRGAKVNKIAGPHRRALNVAAFVGNLEALRMLLDHDANIDPVEEYAYGSALGAAARQGHTDVAQYLLSHGWSSAGSMKTYGSFATAAATYNHLEVFRILIENETRVLVLEQALQAAAQRGYVMIVKAIFDKVTIEPQQLTLRHQRAFSLAAFYGRTEVLQLIFSRGIDQMQLDEALYQATDNEHEETVNSLLKFRADPNAEGPEYGFALAASAYDGTTGIMQALIKANADVNKRGGRYGTALQAAAWFGNADNVKLLLDNGARLNTEPIGIYGNELQAAVYSGDEDTIRLLIENGADVNAQGGSYSYPIIAAVDQGDSVATRILLEKGAHVNVRGGEDNWPVICLAACYLEKDDLKLILKNVADINATCDNGTTALINCADACDAEGLEFLLANDADVHITSTTLGTALHAAASQGDEECCNVLLCAGAKVNAIGGPWGTALQAAAWAEDVESVDVLLDAGADITIKEPIAGEYGTALQAASAAGSLEIVQKLLKRQAAVNVRPANGKYGNALAAACAGNHTHIVELLIENQADVNAKGGVFGFPILAAAQTGDEATVLVLLKHGANANAHGGILGTSVAAAAYSNNLSLIDLLIEHGADVHAKGGKYGCSLQAAAVKADVEIVDSLLDRAIDLLNYRGGKYHTALIAASYFNRLDIVSKLLDAGADFRYQGGTYRSAIAAAAIRGNKTMLEKFLNMKPPDHLLDEAMVEACAYRQSTCVDALLKAGASVYTSHPTLGKPSEALTAPEPEDYNSDIDEDDEQGNQSDESTDEDDLDDVDESWEGDNLSVSSETNDGSVTDLQLEEQVTEQDKIRRLLADAEARSRRNPTVKRFRTLKHRQIPHSLSIGVPILPSVQSMPIAVSRQPTSADQAVNSDYSHCSQEPWNIPFWPASSDEQYAKSHGQTDQQPSMKGQHGTDLARSSTQEQVQSPPLPLRQLQTYGEIQHRQSSIPPPLPERQFSGSSLTRGSQSSAPPSRTGSEDHGLRRQSKAMGRKPISSTGVYHQPQRQPSYPISQSSLDKTISEHDYAVADHHAPINQSMSPYVSPIGSQQYPTPLSHRSSQHFVPPYQGYSSSPPAQYPQYALPPIQASQHSPYGQVPGTMSPTSIQSSQFAYGTSRSSQYTQRDTPTSSTSDLGNFQGTNNTHKTKWTGGGYDGEGYS